MADDIQIKSSNPTSGGSTPAPQSQVGQTNAGSAQGAGNPPVIDLSAMDMMPVGTPATSTMPAASPSSTDANGVVSFNGKTIEVPQMVREKFPDLIDLINNTESMSIEERDYWFQILPIMTEDQIGKFRQILLSEKDQLSALDKEYEDELTRLNEKHMIEWKEFESKEKKKSLTLAEQKSQEEEKAEEEELLKRLSQV